MSGISCEVLFKENEKKMHIFIPKFTINYII